MSIFRRYPPLKLSKRTAECNWQTIMQNKLWDMGLIAYTEKYQASVITNRFDIAIVANKESDIAIGIIEMKAHTSGDMRLHEIEFWKTEQGKRYCEIGKKHGIPVLYCAGPSEINRVAREMKRALSPWWLRWAI